MIGALLGLPTGWALASGVMDGRLLGAPAVPALLLAVVLPSAVLIGVGAAAVPARRSTRLNTLDALRAEG